MTYIPEALRNQIMKDAGGRCGYCLTSQKISGAQMHVDHIVPLAHGGVTEESNLWLAGAQKLSA